MTSRKVYLASAAAALLMLGGGAHAQPAATGAPAAPAAAPTAGATVYDTSGGTVGTIESIEGDFATVATSKNKVRLPLSSFGKGEKGPLLAMTAEQLDAAAAAATPAPAAAPPALAVGMVVKDSAGAEAGKIESVDGDFAVLATTKSKVRLPVASFGAGKDGPVIGMTAAQLDQAAAAAAGG